MWNILCDFSFPWHYCYISIRFCNFFAETSSREISVGSEGVFMDLDYGSNISGAT